MINDEFVLRDVSMLGSLQLPNWHADYGLA
jgi:hypothetical protein